MSSFKEIKALLGKESTLKSENNSKSEIDSRLELEELRYLLSLISNSTFQGRDLQVLYDIAYKIQLQIKKLTQ